ncbi:hypothetical protein KI387_029608, partial [Taxus chinensis]
MVEELACINLDEGASLKKLMEDKKNKEQEVYQLTEVQDKVEKFSKAILEMASNIGDDILE